MIAGIRGRRFSLGLSLAILLILAIVSLMPLYWMITGSFKLQYSAIKVPPEFFPSHPTLKNYYNLLGLDRPTLRWLFNSTFTAGMVAIGVMLLSAMAGYAFGKKEFPGKHVLFWSLIVTMTVPRMVFIIPLFLVMRDFGWFDSYLGLIVPYLCSPFAIFLVRQFMHTIPRDLIDASRIDGASEMGLFARIILPLSKPALGAVGIFTFVQTWNEYIWQLILLNKEHMYTLPLGVSRLVSAGGYYDLGLAMAGATFAFIPMLVVFLAFQDYFVKGLTVGALKG